MNTKRKLRLFIQLSMLGALSMGITSTHDAVAFAAASSISQVAEFHKWKRCQALPLSQQAAMTLL